MPIDGIIVAGETSLDESMLTGESKPVEKGEGAEAIGGSVNGAGAITLAAGVGARRLLLTPAVGAVFMSASTVIVAINARLLRP